MITNYDIGYNGRLGNQLFQFATGIAVAKRLGTEFVIPENTTVKKDGCYDYTNNSWISYKLDLYDGFCISAKMKSINGCEIYNEPHFHYSDTILDVKDNTSIQGYFQSEKYFVEYKDDVLKELHFKFDIFDKAMSLIHDFRYNSIVAIHVRRGDMLKHPNYPVITDEYLQTALSLFDDQEYNFLIISDDIPYCKNIFPESNNIMYSENNDQFVDLCLMSLADHNIISNSTYSWWGAYLNDNPSKKVVAPTKWINDPNINTKDLVPDEWIKI